MAFPRRVAYSFPAIRCLIDFGWILKDWYFSDTPGGAIYPPPADHKLAKASIHYIYASVTVKGMEWDMIGPDQWIAGEEYRPAVHPQAPR